MHVAFTLSVRGVAGLYYGEEIAMEGKDDPDNRRDFPGGWVEDKHNAFERSGRTGEEDRVHAYVKKLLALRRELEPLRRGSLVQLNSTNDICAFARVTSDASAVMAFNNSSQEQTIRIELVGALAGQKKFFNRLDSIQVVSVDSGTVTLTLAARSAAILTPQPPMVTSGKGKNQARSDLRLKD